MLKRVFDFVVSGLAIVILSPLLLTIALVLRCTIGSHVLWRQTRPGLGGRPFTILKFRTMSNEKSTDGTLLPDALRLGRIGSLLRRTSLDELPELINVLRGEMSQVGPRPLLMQYLTLYTREQARRHEVKPGITGWAQVNGRNTITWEKKFQLDVWYVDNGSLWLDIKIIFMTLLQVIKREGINQPGRATMEEFKGMMQKP